MKNTLKFVFSMKVEGGGHYSRAVNDGMRTVFSRDVVWGKLLI